jgi:hypothetical protein
MPEVPYRETLMKTAYFDCYCGAGGDMIVAAMLHAGLDPAFLRDRIRSLRIDHLELDISTVVRGGISATYFKPIVPRQHHHRTLPQIVDIIRNSSIAEPAVTAAVEIFTKLAQIEGKIHAKPPSEIAFHEVGAVDSIVDIVAACAGFTALSIEDVCCSPLSVGGGTVKCAHGTLPVPVPATIELLAAANAPMIGGPVPYELLTPTAAAVLTHFASRFGPIPAMNVLATGYGAGTRQFDEIPNVLRLIIGNTDDPALCDSVCMLECNVDDATGETVGHIMDRLFDHGALDVFTTAIQMKHNRPAVMISVICPFDAVDKIEQAIFAQGLTLGIRRHTVQRSKLPRQLVTVSTKYGEIRIKTGLFDGRIVSIKPEYSDCAAAADAKNVPLQTVTRAAVKAFESHDKKNVSHKQCNNK